jgi:hypothetical protein
VPDKNEKKKKGKNERVVELLPLVCRGAISSFLWFLGG